MKTDALSVETEASWEGGGGLHPAHPALLSEGSPDDNKMRFVYLINQPPQPL